MSRARQLRPRQRRAPRPSAKSARRRPRSKRTALLRAFDRAALLRAGGHAVSRRALRSRTPCLPRARDVRCARNAHGRSSTLHSARTPPRASASDDVPSRRDEPDFSLTARKSVRVVCHGKIDPQRGSREIYASHGPRAGAGRLQPHAGCASVCALVSSASFSRTFSRLDTYLSFASSATAFSRAVTPFCTSPAVASVTPYAFHSLAFSAFALTSTSYRGRALSAWPRRARRSACSHMLSPTGSRASSAAE
mmetsp:Transcript_7184/g.22664  ORF Transcript_7184/g.22664 Transcript_7184/m.22664 type:complete len:251 (-) Transcript_7184:324-1076(-)